MRLCDVRDYMNTATIPPWQQCPETAAWRAVVAQTDAFLFVVPEYNWSFPGEFKLVLDQELGGYAGKPAIVAGVSSGLFGGSRMIVSLMPFLHKIGLVHLPYPLHFGMVKEFVEKSDEEIRDEYGSRVDKSIKKLLIYESHLRGINEVLSS